MLNLLMMLGDLFIAGIFYKEQMHIAAMVMCFIAGVRFHKLLLKWTP